jgi:hypothetical protein
MYSDEAMEQAPKYADAGSKMGDGSERSTFSGVIGLDPNVPLNAKSRIVERMVRGARATVLAVLLLSAVTIAALAYVLLSKSEEDNFQAEVSKTGCQSPSLKSSTGDADLTPIFVVAPVCQFCTTGLSHGESKCR